jgi:toxin ParE1/3/4
MAHVLAPEAEADLDDIAYYIATNSGSLDLAERHIDAITYRFLLLAEHPRMGRSRVDDLGPGLRSFPVGDYLIVYAIDGVDVHILRVVHGRRDLPALFQR